MRRIGTKHARLGMVLTRPVFDNRGYLLLEQGSEMNRQDMAILASRNVSLRAKKRIQAKTGLSR